MKRSRVTTLQIAVCCVIAFTTLCARAELNLTNFSAAHPIKIMPMGDSITDDCEVQGAWRMYLQFLLDSNSIPFTFVGRQVTLSPPSPKFTKTRHEGYCGAVVAPPGLYAANGYTATNNYLQKIGPDALTNAVPDIILILIGANDLGRGRNPFQVATNDMAKLLGRLFSNAPNANVILAKPTTLSNASVPSLSLFYGAYATNVPIYSAALQALVNQRRAAGQNIALADMFSVVDHATMFMSDDLHPNNTGLSAVAQEWFTRIRTILTGTNRITASLIYGGDLWRYSDPATDPGTNWTQPGFDDSGWNTGCGRFGWGEASDQTILQTNTTSYFRKAFVVSWNQVFTNLSFRLAQTGGAVVWLNGQEVFRTNLPSGPVGFATQATRTLTGDSPSIYYQTTLAGTNLLVGTNIIAVETHQASGTNASAGFDMELIGGAYVLPPPTLAAALAQTNIVLSWPANNGSTFTLYSAPTLAAGSWQAVNAPLETNSDQITASVPLGVSPLFFRLQQP